MNFILGILLFVLAFGQVRNFLYGAVVARLKADRLKSDDPYVRFLGTFVWTAIVATALIWSGVILVSL